MMSSFRALYPTYSFTYHLPGVIWNWYDPYWNPDRRPDALDDMFVSVRFVISYRAVSVFPPADSLSCISCDSVVVLTIVPSPSTRYLISETLPPPASTTWLAAGMASTVSSAEWSCWNAVFLQPYPRSIWTFSMPMYWFV